MIYLYVLSHMCILQFYSKHLYTSILSLVFVLYYISGSTMCCLYRVYCVYYKSADLVFVYELGIIANTLPKDVRLIPDLIIIVICLIDTD